MTDSNFRSDRARDPLAELARLIGQGDASSGGHSRESYESVAQRASAASDPDWAHEDRYPSPNAHADRRYAADPRVEARYAAPSAPSYPASPPSSDYYAPQQEYSPHQADDREYQEPAGSRYFSGPAGQFNGFREEPDQGLQHYDDEGPQHLPPARDLAAYPADDNAYETDERYYAEDEAAAADHDAPRSGRRTALVAVMAVLGLVIVGTAGAFGYRAMFGGSVLPTLPPIIKASNGPNKISLDPQAGAANSSGQASVATTGSTENLVSREEQPVTIEAPRAPPRVVSTIPIVSDGQSVMPPGMSGMPPATTNQAGPNRAVSADSPWPAPPSTLPAPSPAAAPAAASPPPAPISSEPKKIHTVTIRADQTGAVPDGAAGSSAPAAAGTHSQIRPAGAPKTTAAVAAGGSGPMSLVPGGQGDAAPAPARTRVAAAPAAASSSPAPHASGGGSYVQVTSRRTEGEAQADFRAMQAKFPDQLSGREPIIHRADLGEKGTYYRALVGPFASTEEAAQLCSGLKAAGGKCIVQRN
jgi:SPOR domain